MKAVDDILRLLREADGDTRALSVLWVLARLGNRLLMREHFHLIIIL